MTRTKIAARYICPLLVHATSLCHVRDLTMEYAQRGVVNESLHVTCCACKHSNGPNEAGQSGIIRIPANRVGSSDQEVKHNQEGYQERPRHEVIFHTSRGNTQPRWLKRRPGKFNNAQVLLQKCLLGKGTRATDGGRNNVGVRARRMP